MNKLALTAALGAACIGLGACAESGGNNAAIDHEAADTAAAEGNGAGAGGTTAASTYPKGARIVEENGVTYRIDADGTRVALGADEGRILVENGTRYRVDSSGSRVRISDDGLDIDIDGPDIDMPDVDVGINNKGNLDVDVGDKDPDGGR